MTAYKLKNDCAKEIEQKLREKGSLLLTQEWNCWIQFFYQQLESVDMQSVSRDIPAFTAVGVDDKEFVLYECADTLKPSENLEIPTIVTNITEIDSRVFEKINAYNLIKKSVKKIKYIFKHFRYDGISVLLSDNVLILDGPDAHAKIASIIPASIVSSFSSLGINSGFVRPFFRSLDESAKTAFWVYQFARQTERVFPPEEKPREVEFRDCLFAKDFVVA